MFIMLVFPSKEVTLNGAEMGMDRRPRRSREGSRGCLDAVLNVGSAKGFLNWNTFASGFRPFFSFTGTPENQRRCTLAADLSSTSDSRVLERAREVVGAGSD